MIGKPDAELGDAERPPRAREPGAAEGSGAAAAREPGAEGPAAADRWLADAMPQIVWVAGPEGQVAYMNRRWADYTGAAEGERPDWSSRVHPDDQSGARLLWARAHAAGERCEMVYRLRGADGGYRWFLGRVEPARDEAGRIVRWVGTATDIDDQKRVEAERDALLARERETRARAEEANRLKDDFLATLSHELRTPLNAIVGWTHVLRDDESGPVERARTLETILRNAKLLTALIEDLLDVSRIVRGGLRLELGRVDVARVLEAAVEGARPTAAAKGVRLGLRAGADAGEVTGDPQRLQQVVWNLLSNALRFTGPGGEVEASARRVGREVVIEVRDNGRGIAAEALPHLFERFWQGDVRSRGGLGLGLSIVKHLVELHGGAVSAESEGVGRGAAFTVRLPAAPARGPSAGGGGEAGGGPGAALPEGALAGALVLVVDDEPDTLELLVTIFSRQGATVVGARSTPEALEALGRLRPDVIVSDIGLPGQSGYELMRQVRASGEEAGGWVPALALTGYAGEGDGREALLAGFQMHLSKPVDPAALVAGVAKLWRRGKGGEGTTP
ncbi:MAG TPA: ATP-binding protein [Polyangiaceae bacterium]|nr:ATP-binding protein [Polyangiaceae bacterium]